MSEREDLLTPQRCERLYPLVLAVDLQGAVSHVSHRLQERVGGECVGASFDAHFEVSRPRLSRPVSRLDLKQYEKSLFLFTDIQKRFGFRGQVVHGVQQRDGQWVDVFIFVVSPWLTWNKEHIPGYEPNFAEFTIADPQIDLSIQLSVQAASLENQRKITEELLRARDQAQEASRAKSRFVAHVTHELRTPLNGIIGALDLIADQAHTPLVAELFGMLQDSAHTLLGTVNTILDFSRIQSGRIELVPEPFSPVEVIGDIVSMLSVQATVKGLRLQMDIWEVDVELVEGDW